MKIEKNSVLEQLTKLRNNAKEHHIESSQTAKPLPATPQDKLEIADQVALQQLTESGTLHTLTNYTRAILLDKFGSAISNDPGFEGLLTDIIEALQLHPVFDQIMQRIVAGTESSLENAELLSIVKRGKDKG